MFIAANYVMNYYPKHNISPVLQTKPLVTDTVGVTDRIHFDQIEAVLAIPKEELRILNPQYRSDVIPGSPERPYMLVLPSKQIHAYLMSHDEILSYQANKYARRTSAEPGETLDTDTPVFAANDPQDTADDLPATEVAAAAPTSITHKVASGETLNSIAAKYGVAAADIRSANNLRRNAVRVGQILTINGVAPDKATASAASAATTQKEAEQLVAMVANDEKPATQPQTTTRQKTQPKAETTTKKSNKKETAKNNKKNTTQASKKQKQTTHTIKDGENLGRIAKKYGTTVDAIKKANGMKNDNIRAGATLKIPAKKK